MENINWKKVFLYGGIAIGVGALGTLGYALIAGDAEEDNQKETQIFQDETLGISFEYPENWFVQREELMAGVSVVFLKQEDNPFPNTISTEILPSNIEPERFFQFVYQNLSTKPEIKNLKIQKDFKLKNVDENFAMTYRLQDEQATVDVFHVCFVRAECGYQCQYMHEPSKFNNGEPMKKILSTLQFLDSPLLKEKLEQDKQMIRQMFDQLKLQQEGNVKVEEQEIEDVNGVD